jgi:hypothetical protein
MPGSSLLNLETPLVEGSVRHKVRFDGKVPTLLLGMLMGLGLAALLLGAPSGVLSGSSPNAVAMDSFRPQGIAADELQVPYMDEEAQLVKELKAEEGKKDKLEKEAKPTPEEDWQCHHWDASDIGQASFKDTAKQPEICEMHRGHGYDYKFTKGDDNLAPGCNSCWCCSREVDHAAALKYEEDKLLTELETHEQSCLVTANKDGDKTDFKAQDSKAKYPCLQAAATKFFTALETEGKACLKYNSTDADGGQACFEDPLFKAGQGQQEAAKEQKQPAVPEPALAKAKNLLSKKAPYTNPFSLPKEALRKPDLRIPA